MKLIREEFETSPIFVYIGDEELANKKIDGSKLDRKNITVSR